MIIHVSLFFKTPLGKFSEGRFIFAFFAHCNDIRAANNFLFRAPYNMRNAVERCFVVAFICKT